MKNKDCSVISDLDISSLASKIIYKSNHIIVIQSFSGPIKETVVGNWNRLVWVCPDFALIRFMAWSLNVLRQNVDWGREREEVYVGLEGGRRGRENKLSFRTNPDTLAHSTLHHEDRSSQEEPHHLNGLHWRRSPPALPHQSSCTAKLG